ncbi:MAG: hypothetical protein ABI690_30225 [Chloroflexota bacterium]
MRRSGEILTAVDHSPVPAVFSPTRRRFSCFPPSILAHLVALRGLPALRFSTRRRQYSENGESCANFSPPTTTTAT